MSLIDNFPMRTRITNDVLSFRPSPQAGQKSTEVYYRPIGLLLILITVGLAVMSVIVKDNLDALTVNSANSTQWSLTQVETDYLWLLDAVHHAAELESAPEATVRFAFNDVRARYDQLRIRLSTLEAGRDTASFKKASLLSELTAAVDQLRPLLDQSDEQIAQQLNLLTERLHDIEDPIRRTVILGTRTLVADAEERQMGIAKNLRQFGVLGIAIFVLMGCAIVYAFRNAMRSQTQERKLSIASARLSAIVNNALDAIIVTNSAGKFVEFNSAAEEILGYSRSDVIGKPIADFLVPADMMDGPGDGMKRFVEDDMSQIVNSGRFETKAKCKDGSVIAVEMAIQSDESAFARVYICFLRDISERKQAEEQLLKARDEALSSERAKSEFLAVMSHEMRTPLNGLLGTLDLMKTGSQTEQDAEHLRIMEISSKQLLMHVNDVLDISRLDADEDNFAIEPFDLSQLIHDTLASLRASADKRGNVFNTDRVPQTIWVNGDAARVGQLLLNIVGNAIKFTENGIITLTAQHLETGCFELKVSDTGIGIAPDKIDTLFDDFVRIDSGYTRQTQGAGLGLAIVRRIVNRIGGEASVISDLGKGTTVTLVLDLPSVDKPDDVLLTQKRKQVVSAKPLNILVIEDNTINRLILCRMLQNMGHDVVSATNGMDGIERARTHAFDVIFMDVSMPVMDGLTATEKIRNGDGANKTTPIIAATANALLTDIENYKNAGMNDYLFKPITMEAIQTLFVRLEFENDQVKPTQMSLNSKDKTVLDEDILNAAREVLDEGSFNRIAQKFMLEGNALMDMLQSTCGQPGDGVEVSKALHKLLGSAQMMGATKLAAILSEAEQRTLAEKTNPTLDDFSTIQTHWTETRQMISDLTTA